MYALRLWIDASCWVEVVGIAGQYGVRWLMWWKGAIIIHDSSAPCLASLSASSFANMFVCAPTFWILILWARVLLTL